jgi:hypothetical protein
MLNPKSTKLSLTHKAKDDSDTSSVNLKDKVGGSFKDRLALKSNTGPNIMATLQTSCFHVDTLTSLFQEASFSMVSDGE